MTDIELYNKLKPIENKIREFERTNGCVLTTEDIYLINNIYPKLREITGGQIKNRFNSGCSTCVRETFRIIIDIYNRLSPVSNKNI